MGTDGAGVHTTGLAAPLTARPGVQRMALSEAVSPQRPAGSRAAASGLWGSHDHWLLAVAGSGHVQVIASTDASVAGVVSRPLADLSPADVAAVTSALRDAAPGSAARFLELLHDVQRFGAEVALGGADVAHPSGPDDVALATDGEDSG
jgi:hypothetical protein